MSPCDWRHLSFCGVMRLLSTKLNFLHEQILSSVSKIASAGMQYISKHGCIIATVMYSINYYSSRRNVRCPRDIVKSCNVRCPRDIVYRISCPPYMHMRGRLVDFCGRYHPHPFLRKMKGRTLLKMCARVVFGAFSGVSWTKKHPKSQIFFARAFGARDSLSYLFSRGRAQKQGTHMSPLV